MTDRELQLIRREGEGYLVEFKESTSNLDKEIVAFANGSGGRIFIGIRDDGTIRGIRSSNTLRSQVQDIANNCDPPIPIILEEQNNILIVNVREGTDKPYKCSAGFYLRTGPNSQKLERNEILSLFKSEGKIRFDELECKYFTYSRDFDREKLRRFLRLSKTPSLLNEKDMLVNLGVAEKQGKQIILKNSGALFFAKDLSRLYQHTAVTCVLYKGTERVEVLDRRDFNEDLISSLEQAMLFLKRYLAVRYAMKGSLRRDEILEIPYGALREGIVNAVAHRDYFEHGANAMVEVFDDRIEMSNPGGLVKGLDPSDFGKKSILRNPNIASLLHRAGYVEKIGTGIPKMRKLLREAKLRPPEFSFDKFFTVTFRRIVKAVAVAHPIRDAVDEAVNDAVREGVLEGIDEGVRDTVRDTVDDTVHDTINDTIRARLIIRLLYLLENRAASLQEMGSLFKISPRTVKRDIAILKRSGLVTFEGTTRKGKYTLSVKGKTLIQGRKTGGSRAKR